MLVYRIAILIPNLMLCRSNFLYGVAYDSSTIGYPLAACIWRCLRAWLAHFYAADISTAFRKD